MEARFLRGWPRLLIKGRSPCFSCTSFFMRSRKAQIFSTRLDSRLIRNHEFSVPWFVMYNDRKHYLIGSWWDPRYGHHEKTPAIHTTGVLFNSSASYITIPMKHPWHLFSSWLCATEGTAKEKVIKTVRIAILIVCTFFIVYSSLSSIFLTIIQV